MKYLGIDVGSLFAAIVLVDKTGEIQARDYRRHQGDPLACLRNMLAGHDLQEVAAVVRTGSGGQGIPLSGQYIDAVVAGLEGVKQLVPDARNIIAIGGGSFTLTEMGADGAYRSSRLNSACASGTGAFLDQQALRLQVPPEELAQCAMRYDKRPPGVATRCAVFAKSDMIHLQQEGYSVEAIAAGLCAGLGRSTVDGLLGGRKLEGKVVVIGGVARNAVVVEAVRETLGLETVVPENPELVGAVGAAMVALRHGNSNDDKVDFSRLEVTKSATAERRAMHLRPPLKLELSTYPDFSWHDSWVNDDGSEIAIVTPRSGTITVSMGIDIGSTSTKAVLLDDEKKVVGWVYRKTAGDPIRAVQRMFRAFTQMQERGNFRIDVRGVGTTGSGRKMIGKVIGADLAINEITAHATAAVFIDPEVDTIIELGGQDAKFTQLQNGMVYNSIMNYVCAAGTGSFVEEQALKLDIPLAEYAERAMGRECPQTSDRCTVYMERDLDLLLAQGWGKDQVAAAVLHSVRDNYLNKVVGGLYIGEHVYFQGATARNQALVAAFEVELGKPIKVSRYCHLTGSLGMALLVRDRVAPEKRSRNFKGLEFADQEVNIEYEQCSLCNNLCNLSIIHIGDETVAWGLKCGRDYESRKVRVRKITTYDHWQARQTAWARKIEIAAQPGGNATGGRAAPRVGILRSLGTYGYYPYWNAFLSALGCEVVLSPRSGENVLHAGNEITTAEYCAPVVMSHGHARELLEKGNLDYLFVPHMLREPVADGFTDAHFCCYVQAHPGVLRSLGSLEKLGIREKLLAPVVQMNMPHAYQVDRLLEAVGTALGAGRADVSRALEAAQAAQREFLDTALRCGREAMERITHEDTLGIVCIGRPYNTVDPGLTIDLPRKIAELGYPVLYMDMLPVNLADILPGHNNMYWHYGQKILAAAEYIARQNRLFGVYFTNFMCGPDSYIMTYFKEIMGRVGKPYLCLQFDGHGADAGYLTRVEAALESFHSWSSIPRSEQKKTEAVAAEV